MKKVIGLTVVGMMLVIVGAIWIYNYESLQKPLDRVLLADPRNQVVKARSTFDGWIDFTRVTFEITGISQNASRADVFRVFLQYSAALKDSRFKQVTLAAFGRKKFLVPGDYFQQLGQEFSTQNPVYTIRTFPEHIANMDGSPAFDTYTGGMIAVLGKEMEQFTEFSDRWYGNDLSATK